MSGSIPDVSMYFFKFLIATSTKAALPPQQDDRRMIDGDRNSIRTRSGTRVFRFP